jgi:hypothetical protein
VGGDQRTMRRAVESTGERLQAFRHDGFVENNLM